MHEQPAMLGVFALALTVRLAHIFQMRDSLLFTVLLGDSRGYDEWARQLAAGDWIGTEVFYQAPLYPYFLGSVYALLGGDPFVARVVQAVIGAASCAALVYAGTRLFSLRAGLVAGVLMALYSSAVFFDALIQKSALDLFFTSVALALISLVIAGTARPRLTWFALGVTVAALCLTRENALLLAALLPAWALIRRDWVAALLLAAGMASLFVPVAARNAAVGGGFYLTTSQLGPNFFIGNNPLSDGTYMSLRQGRGSPEFERRDATELAEEAAGRSLTPAEVSRYWLDRSFEFIRSEPRAWAALLARKTALLVNAAEMLDTESQESHAEHSAVLAMLAPVTHFGILIPLAVFGAVVGWRRELWIVYVLVLSYAASVVVFFVMARYRHPLLPFLLLFAAAGPAEATRFLTTASNARKLGVATAVMVAVLVTNRPMLSGSLSRAITEHNLGTALQEQGRLDEAIARYHRALTIEPEYAPAHNNLGTALMAKGELEEAVVAFREAARLQPYSVNARELLASAVYDLGSDQMERGAMLEAELSLREAIRLKPDYAEAHNNLGVLLASTGRLYEAVQHWRRALEIKPDLVDAARNLAMAERQ
jgi:Flp pilus assembly protein TadD